MDFNLEDCLAFLTLNCGKKLAETLEKKLANYSITRSQWIAMYYIDKYEGILQNEIASRMSIKEPSVVRMLDKMEKLGWTQRKPSEWDKRTKIVSLTSDGKEKFLETEKYVIEFKDKVTEGISGEKLEIFKEVLQMMEDNSYNMI